MQISLAATTLTYGLLFGMGCGPSYAPPMTAAMRWFPRNKGLVNGIIVGGFGLGASIFNIVQTGYMNPLNKTPSDHGYFSLEQDDVLQRVPSVFLLLGIDRDLVFTINAFSLSTVSNSMRILTF